MAQRVKLTLVMLPYRIEMRVQILALLLEIQVHAYVREKAMENDSSHWAPVTHMGNQDRVADSWL